ncbi:hypothetical protein J7K25_04230 [bacterium]|nr:hypothetical protein [bacterium]
MKKVVRFVVGVSLILGFAGFVSAGTQAGDKTFNIYASISIPEEGDTTWMAMISGGYFMTDQFQLEGATALIGTEDLTFGMIMLRPNLHFATAGTTVPYIGGTLGTTFGDYDTEFIYGGQIGLKQFINERTFLQWEGSYTIMDVEGDSSGTFMITLSIGLKF